MDSGKIQAGVGGFLLGPHVDRDVGLLWPELLSAEIRRGPDGGTALFAGAEQREGRTRTVDFFRPRDVCVGTLHGRWRVFVGLLPAESGTVANGCAGRPGQGLPLLYRA